MSAIYAVIFANLKGNLGDFAILHSMLADIKQRVPDSEIHVYSQPFVSVDAGRLEKFKQGCPPFEYKGPMFHDTSPLGPAGTSVLRRIGALRWYQGCRTNRLARQAAADFAARFAGYHAIFIAGGAQWTGINSGVSMFANLRAIWSYNQKIYSYPVSVSKALRKVNARRALSNDLSKICTPLIARDSQTRQTFEDMDLSVVLGADCVFSLASLVETIEVKTVQADRLILVLTGQKQQDIERGIDNAIVAGYRPALLTTCGLEDAPIQKPVADHFEVPFLAPATWQEAVAEMRSSGIVVTNRLHGIILSSFAEACVLPLVDRPKVKAVVQDALLPVSLESLSGLSEAKLRAASAQRDQIRLALTSYRDRCQALTWSPLSTVLNDAHIR